MRANVLIFDWADSWGMVEDVPVGAERIEAYVSFGSTQTEEEAIRLADAELARFRDGQTQVTVGVDPTTGDVPFTDFGVGDTVDVDGEDRRCVALTFGRDPQRDGRLVFVPQFGDVIESASARQQWLSKKMANGSLGGLSRSARPAAPPLVIAPDANVRIPVQRVTQVEYDAMVAAGSLVDGVMYAIVL